MNKTEQTREAVARAIWNIRREDEDRCDMELEDMGKDHSVWREADAVIAALSQSEAPAEQPEDKRDALTQAPQERNSAGETPTEHAHRWATELAVSMASKFYPAVAQWKPLPDLLGVITQIDNMVAGLVRAPQERAAVTDAEIVERAYAYQSAEICKPDHELSRDELIAFGRDLLSLAQSSEGAKP